MSAQSAQLVCSPGWSDLDVGQGFAIAGTHIPKKKTPSRCPLKRLPLRTPASSSLGKLATCPEEHRAYSPDIDINPSTPVAPGPQPIHGQRQEPVPRLTNALAPVQYRDMPLPSGVPSGVLGSRPAQFLFQLLLSLALLPSGAGCEPASLVGKAGACSVRCAETAW